MKKSLLLVLMGLNYCAVAQWKSNGNRIYYDQEGVIIGDSIPIINRENSKLSVISSFDAYGGGGYGLFNTHSTDYPLLKFKSVCAIGYSSIWSTQAQGAAIASTLTLSRDNANTYNTWCGGGVFQLTFDNYIPAGSNTSCHYLGGTCGFINGSISSYPQTSVISAVIGEDQIRSDHTYAGYFNGKGYFSDNVGIGISNPEEKLEVKGNIKFSDPNTGLDLKSPDGSEWKVTIDNKGKLKSERVKIKTDSGTVVNISSDPHSDQIHIALSNPVIKSFDVELFDESGRMIYMRNYQTSKITIDISDFKNGLYVLKVVNENGILIGSDMVTKR
jgi:hypothetical protein